MIIGIDHIQISIPKGKLNLALQFYVDALQFTRVPKPPTLSQDGAWLVQNSVNLHLGEDANFVTDGHAHPAFKVNAIDQIMQRCIDAGYRQRWDTGPDGFKRGSVFDPFGNRIELMEQIHPSTT